MNSSTTSGQPRMLSLEEFATLIRKMREAFQWSQETLAELAGLNVRTVQRVENAKSASIDTRRALAVAFEIEDIDAFNKPFAIPTEEELKAEKARIERDYITLPAIPLSTGRQLATLAESSTVDISQPGFEMKRDAQEIFASLVDYFRDYKDCASNYSESAKFVVYDEMQELIDELQQLEVAIQFATRKVHLKVTDQHSETKPLTVQMSYLIAFERGKAPSEFAVQKKLDIPF
ncbi:helix-turn-helix domain-containing protein [Pseudomonas sp. LPH60]|uniref:helix-turn-helix domain-containing protein n=1 Tax=Pseudomonas sp. LPH60 TaxID=3065906 RepID=UPI00273C7245|nr:helix-turn-helix domain-containing protein [Pseudomonas sp. LPH60]MDP4569891.1 helix-turn-helix domain-containing protein [Pseudomonas sp. LPH60]